LEVFIIKASKALLSLFVLVLILTACSSKSGSATDGAKNMQDTLVELRQNVDANDSAKAKVSADKLEESWKTFEDDIKKNQADVYGKVEDPLGAIQTGAKQTKLDQATLKDQINKLNEALKQIK
jgi:hypothetical protein